MNENELDKEVREKRKMEENDYAKYENYLRLL